MSWLVGGQPWKRFPHVFLVCLVQHHLQTKWWFQRSFIFTLFGEDSHFDSYFSKELKPPTRYIFHSILTGQVVCHILENHSQKRPTPNSPKVVYRDDPWQISKDFCHSRWVFQRKGEGLYPKVLT